VYLRPDSSIEARPGDFSSRIVGSDLLVPLQVAEFAQSVHLRTAEELVGYAEAFPTTVAVSLGWGPAAVTAAVGRLHEQLSSVGFVRAPARAKRAYGFGRS
jgi:hypothetical protein